LTPHARGERVTETLEQKVGAALRIFAAVELALFYPT